MEQTIYITIVGLVSGITGTGIGGLAAFFVNRITNRILGFILEFSAGLMTAVVCFELIPRAFELGGVLYTLAGVLFGAITIVAMENSIKNSRILKSGKNKGLLRAGILMAIAIALHNFPEGFAVGSGFKASASLGFTITAVIMIHDIPEGIAMSVPMRAGGFSRIKAFTYTVLSGIPMGLGAFFGSVLSGLSSGFIAACLGFAGGAMLYIVYGELIPESKKLYLGRLSSLGNVAGILCGIIVSVYN